MENNHENGVPSLIFKKWNKNQSPITSMVLIDVQVKWFTTLKQNIVTY